MITDTICIDTEEMPHFYKAFERGQGINVIIIDKVKASERFPKILFIQVSALGASSFFSLGYYLLKSKKGELVY